MGRQQELFVETTKSKQFYLSELMGMNVVSAQGMALGKAYDVVVDMDLPEPEVRKLVYRRKWSRKDLTVPWQAVDRIEKDAIVLKSEAPLPVPLERSPSEILLRSFLLDKQIVDIHGAKVERVNDLQLLKSNGKLLLIQVDVGMRGLLRRLGWEDAFVRFTRWFFDYTPKERYIAWHYAQPLADPDRLRLQVSQSTLASLHPADLADIIEEMDVHERAAVVESLTLDVVADALEEVDPRVQVSIMRGLDPDRAADIIEEMSPDEAADLLADLPKETKMVIFEEMDDEYERTVKGLLEHDEDEAGGLMSTHLITLPPDTTIVDALAHIKRQATDTDVIYYIYVVDGDGKLLGVTNLRELLTNEIFTPLERIMTSRVITAKVDDSAHDLAHMFAKYGFRGIPVVDEEYRILGVIRFKALLEILAPHLGR